MHYIPNPFHSHVHIHSHLHTHTHRSGNEHDHNHRSNHYLKSHPQVEHAYEVHHHHQAESAGTNKDEVKNVHKHSQDHDVLEHFGLENQEDESSADGRKKEGKNSFKIQLYPGIYYQYGFNVNENVAENYFHGNNNFFLIYFQNPPSPPPEYTLS